MMLPKPPSPRRPAAGHGRPTRTPPPSAPGHTPPPPPPPRQFVGVRPAVSDLNLVLRARLQIIRQDPQEPMQPNIHSDGVDINHNVVTDKNKPEE